jgi:hypothetical protein
MAPIYDSTFSPDLYWVKNNLKLSTVFALTCTIRVRICETFFASAEQVDDQRPSESA